MGKGCGQLASANQSTRVLFGPWFSLSQNECGTRYVPGAPFGGDWGEGRAQGVGDPLSHLSLAAAPSLIDAALGRGTWNWTVRWTVVVVPSI